MYLVKGECCCFVWFVFVVSVEVARRLSLPVVDVGVIISMILLCLSHVGWLLNKKAARRGVNISLAILHWEEIPLLAFCP